MIHYCPLVWQGTFLLVLENGFERISMSWKDLEEPWVNKRLRIKNLNLQETQVFLLHNDFEYLKMWFDAIVTSISHWRLWVESLLSEGNYSKNCFSFSYACIKQSRKSRREETKFSPTKKGLKHFRVFSIQDTFWKLFAPFISPQIDRRTLNREGEIRVLLLAFVV